MANNLDETSEVVMVEETKPDPHTYEFQLTSPDGSGKITTETAIGFLYVTSAFVGVGMGDGEVRYVVPLERVFRVKQIDGAVNINKTVGNA